MLSRICHGPGTTQAGTEQPAGAQQLPAGQGVGEGVAEGARSLWFGAGSGVAVQPAHGVTELQASFHLQTQDQKDNQQQPEKGLLLSLSTLSPSQTSVSHQKPSRLPQTSLLAAHQSLRPATGSSLNQLPASRTIIWTVMETWPVSESPVRLSHHTCPCCQRLGFKPPPNHLPSYPPAEHPALAFSIKLWWGGGLPGELNFKSRT